MSDIKGYIHSLESFGLVDGPGVRFVIFLSGCAMRCNFCHNPDTWDMGSGTLYSADELVKKALRCKPYWGKKGGGGITASGGEPLLQTDFVTELFKKAKENGIHTALDTSGQPFSNSPKFLEKLDELIKFTDLVLLDIKHINNEEHIKITEYPNYNILEFAKYLSDSRKPVWIRHVLVPGYSDNDEYLNELYNFLTTLSNVEKTEVLPYHTLGVAKYKSLGIPYKLNDVLAPTAERIENANRLLHTSEIKF